MKMRSVIAVALLLLSTGCAMRGGTGNPNQQLEGQVAFYARQVMVSADTALSAVEILTDQRLALAANNPVKQEAIKADARAVITIFKQVGEGGQRLTVALRAIDAATKDVDRANAIESARAILQGMNRLVTDGTIPVTDDVTRGAVLRLFGNLSDLLMQLAFVLPKTATA